MTSITFRSTTWIIWARNMIQEYLNYNFYNIIETITVLSKWLVKNGQKTGFLGSILVTSNGGQFTFDLILPTELLPLEMNHHRNFQVPKWSLFAVSWTYKITWFFFTNISLLFLKKRQACLKHIMKWLDCTENLYLYPCDYLDLLYLTSDVDPDTVGSAFIWVSGVIKLRKKKSLSKDFFFENYIFKSQTKIK